MTTVVHERDWQSWTNSPDLQSIVGRDGRFRAVNPAWTTMLGYSPDEIVGHSIVEFVLRENVVFSRRGFDEILCGIDLRSFENCVIQKNGQLRWISWSAWAEQDLVLVCGTDVTAQKVDKTRSMSGSGLHTILQDDSHYQALLKPDGVLFSANPGAQFGTPVVLADLVGKPLWTAPWFEASPGMSDFVKSAVRLAAVGNIVQQEIEVSVSPRRRRRVEFTLRPLRDDGGGIEALLHTAVDRANDQGAAACLHQTQKMQALGDLVSGVTHAFANTLKNIEEPLGIAQGLISDGRLGEATRLVAGVRASTRHASRVAQRLLNLAAARPFEARPIDVGRTVVAFMEVMRDVLGHKIEIDISCDDVWPVLADASRFESVLLNLCVNARDAMPDGGKIEAKTINMSVTADVAAQIGLSIGDYVCVSVADSGKGMSNEIFKWPGEPFFTTKALARGTGLGLFMASKFANDAGGRMRVASDVNKGTIVSLYLPRHVD
jgi:PAS domain S-box-containing protein